MTRYISTDPGDWELVGGIDKRIRGHSHRAEPDDDLIRHDISIQYLRDWGYGDDVWGEVTIFHVALSRTRLQHLRDALRA
jgi:hypothetical protein